LVGIYAAERESPGKLEKVSKTRPMTHDLIKTLLMDSMPASAKGW